MSKWRYLQHQYALQQFGVMGLLVRAFFARMEVTNALPTASTLAIPFNVVTCTQWADKQ